MATAVIGALRVNLGLNSASFRSGLGQSKNSVADFAKKSMAAFAALSAAAGVAFAKVVSAAGKADEMFKAAQSLGVPIEDLGRMAHAAEMSGSSFEGLSKGIRKASQTIQQAIDGATNEGAAALHNLGVQLTNTGGRSRKVQDVILDLSDKFKEMPDGVNKTAIAMAVFGRSGTELIPMLNQGSDAIRDMGDEAERLGLVFSDKTGRASERFNDNIARLQKSMTGLWNRVLADVIPSFVALTDKVVAAMTAGDNFDTIVRVIAGGMNILVKAIAIVFDHLQDLYDLFRVFVAAKIITFMAGLAGTFITLARTVRTAGLTMLIVTKVTRAKLTAILLLAAGIAKLTGTYEDLVGWIEEFSKSVLDSLPEGIKQGIEDLAGVMDGMGDAIEATDHVAASSLETYLRLGNEASLSFGKAESGAKKTKVALTDAEKAAQKMADSVTSGFQSIGNDIRGLIDGTNSWNDVLLNVVSTLAKIAFQQFSQSMGGFGGSGLLGNIIGGVVQGLVGFASGGSFKVGGTGLTDSQPVMFKASPNEVVNVMTPQQQREAKNNTGGGSVFKQTNQITIQTPDVRSFKQSESQIAGRLALMTQRGARNL